MQRPVVAEGLSQVPPFLSLPPIENLFREVHLKLSSDFDSISSSLKLQLSLPNECEFDAIRPSLAIPYNLLYQLEILRDKQEDFCKHLDLI